MNQKTVFGALFVTALTLVLIVWASRETTTALPKKGPWWAIEGATAYTMTSKLPVKGATLLFRGDTIMKVGTKVKLPKGTRIVKALGKVLTPGIVLAGTRLGLVEVSLERSTRNDSMPSKRPVRAAFRAADGLNHNSTLIPVARVEGITAVLSQPFGGLISGQSALINLWGTPDQMAVRTSLAVHAAIPTGNAGYAWLKLREALDAGRVYNTYKHKYFRRKIRDLPHSRLDLEALARVIRRELPLVLQVHRAADILTALKLASNYDIQLILSGAAEGWQVAAKIARAKVPVLLGAPYNLPASFSRLGSRYDNAALLHKAGVLLAFSANGGAHNIRAMRYEAGIAVAWGLPYHAALQALTSNFYKIFGLEKQYGTLSRGSKANMVLWTGDPVELSTRVARVWIRGHRVPLVSRQTQLRERYRNIKMLFRRP